MADRFDVIVVGARCAGAPLATLLARQGLEVALVERARFPKDTLSTHIIQAPAINFFKRLGVLEQVQDTGARSVQRINLRQEDFQHEFEIARRPGDNGALMSVRRFVLDPILADAAKKAGAKMFMSTNVTGLVTEGGRVTGVKATYRGKERELRGRLVVGADGRNSTVAELAGARKYNITRGERFGYWSFFADADIGPDPELVFHRWDGRFVIAMPTDGGLYQVIELPDMRFLPDFKRDREAAFMEHARSSRPVAQVIESARRVGKMLGVLKFECFFRESAGPGWALGGDAGHFKDPAPGQGMSDAFRQVEALAPVIIGAIRGSEADLDQALATWARWRDRDAAEIYWLAHDFGAAGLTPGVVVELARRLARQGNALALGDVLQHRVRPASVFTPARLLAATASLMARPGADRRQVLREATELVTNNVRRQRLLTHPEFVDTTQHRDAGDTEVLEEVAA